MKRLVFALVAVSSVVAVAGSAVAADLPVRAAPAAPPLQNWTGWYVGLNAGGAWGNDSSFDNSVLSSFCNAPLVGCASSQFSNAAAAALPSAFDPDLSGFIGGGQFGYNYQIGQVVWGFEADFQGTSIKGDGIATGTAIPSGFPAHSVTVSGTGSQKLDFLGTVRGRLGWTWDNPWLVYVTGGLAYGHTKTSVTFTDQVGGLAFVAQTPSPPPQATTGVLAGLSERDSNGSSHRSGR